MIKKVLDLEITIHKIEQTHKNIFRDEKKTTFNSSEVISVIGRLKVKEDIVKEIKNLFTFFDTGKKKKLTARDLKNGFERLHESLSFG